MRTMRDLLARLQADHPLTVRDEAGWSEIVIEKDGGLTFTITLPRNVFEWYADARDTSGRQVWADWADYYPDNNEKPKELRAAMAADIEAFVAQLVASKVRIAEGSLEWKEAGKWQSIGLCAA